MKTDYIIGGSTLPTCLAYPRFLLTTDMKLIDRVVYAVLLDEVTRSQDKGWVDKHGRLYVAHPADYIARIIDRTPVTVRNAINALEEMGLVKRRLTSHKTPDHIYVKLPSGEGGK